MWAGSNQKYDDALSVIEEALTDSAKYVFAIEVRKDLAGGIAFELLHTACRSAVSTSYWLSSRYWGRGIMPAALSEAMRHLFHQTPWISGTAKPQRNKLLEIRRFLDSHSP
jgi:RimJ/RimL family protein N-acetyltransferase